MTIKLSPIVHIEVVVHDVEETYQFLHKVFGAEQVEKDFSTYLEKVSGMKIIHASLGGTVFQIIDPGKTEKSHAKHLKKLGPSLHNITFRVDNIHDAIKACKDEGHQIDWVAPFDVSYILGPDTPKPTSDKPNACMVDTMEKIGFRLELFNKPE